MADCKRNAGIAVMEAADSSSAMSKRRKIHELSDDNDGFGIGSLGLNSPAKYWPDDDGDTCSSFCLDRSPASCCSSNESSDVVKDGLRLVDLEAKRFEFETVDSTSINNIKRNSRSLSLYLSQFLSPNQTQTFHQQPTALVLRQRNDAVKRAERGFRGSRLRGGGNRPEKKICGGGEGASGRRDRGVLRGGGEVGAKTLRGKVQLRHCERHAPGGSLPLGLFEALKALTQKK